MNIFLGSVLSALPALAMLMPGMIGDPYEAACSGQLSAYYAFGNSSCPTLESWQKSSCMCQDPRYAQSVVDCIVRMVTARVNETQNATINTSLNAFLGSCSGYNMTDLNAFRANSSSLPVYSANTTGINAGQWPVTTAFSLPEEDLYNAFQANRLGSQSEDRNVRFGSALLAFWLGILIIKSTCHILGSVAPRLAMKVNHWKLVKLFRRQMLIQTNWVLTSLGVSQMEAMIIVAFSALVIIFTFVWLPTYTPSFEYPDNNAAMYGSYIGQRSGVLSLYLIPLLVLFAGRNNFLLWLTGWPLNTFLIFHKWISRGVVLLLLVHAIAYSINRAVEGHYGESYTQSYWLWGIVGMAFASFLFVQGMRFLRRRAYDVFLVMHIVGAAIFFAAGYIHLDKVGNIYGLYYYWAAFAIWGLDRCVRIARVITSGVHKDALVELYGDTLVITMKQPRHWNLLKYPGKFMFIHFWQPSMFWQSHPFTVIVDPENTSQMKLFCKVQKGATLQVAKQINKSFELSQGEKTYANSIEKTPKAAAHMRLSVLMDGPYGHTYDLVEFDECIFVAGGTGITAPFSYIHSYLHNYSHSFQKVKLYWAVRDADAAEGWFQSELCYLRDFHPRVEVHICSSSKGTRLAIDQVIEEAVVNSTGPISVLCCAPVGLCMSTRNAMAKSMGYTKNYVAYFEELFTW